MKLTIQHSRSSYHYDRVVRRVIKSAAPTVGLKGDSSVALVFIEDSKMRALNRQYRGKDKTTNVLAFPNQHTAYSKPHTAVDLGDIFISLSEAKREAIKYGWTLRYAVARLALHGFLHLFGYDHVKEKEAKKMEKIEKEILERYA